MRDFTVKGRINGEDGEVTFRTDSVNADSENFNILEVKFPTDEDKDWYEKNMEPNFRREDNNLATMITFCNDNNCQLTAANSDGSGSVLVHHYDSSESA